MTIELRDLHVSYGESEVLGGLSGVVARGQWLAPIGPNGAGKSTLLRAICGLVSYTGGIAIDGRSVEELGRRPIAQLVAFVPQRPVLPPTMTVANYILLGRTPHISYFGTESKVDRKVVTDVIERLSLGSLSHRRLGETSGGESQRAVLGRALAQQSPILLLDEPTSSLDLGRQQQVLELIDELRLERGLTVVSAMHDLTLAGQFADTLWLMQAGAVTAKGSAKDVLTEDAIKAHYGAVVTVETTDDGTVTVLPLRHRPGT